jgi:hypothetical protein
LGRRLGKAPVVLAGQRGSPVIELGDTEHQFVALPLQAIDDLLLLCFGHRLTIHAAGSIGYPRSTAARRRCNRRRE